MTWPLGQHSQPETWTRRRSAVWAQRAGYAKDASAYGHHGRVLNEALAVFDRIRARLDSDGMHPGVRLRDAQTRILREELVYRPRTPGAGAER